MLLLNTKTDNNIILFLFYFWNIELGLMFDYRTRAIITRGLYTFYPPFEVQKVFSRVFFLKLLALCMVSIQERFLIKSGL